MTFQQPALFADCLHFGGNLSILIHKRYFLNSRPLHYCMHKLPGLYPILSLMEAQMVSNLSLLQ